MERVEREWNAMNAQWTRCESNMLAAPRRANGERLKRAPATTAESSRVRYLSRAHFKNVNNSSFTLIKAKLSPMELFILFSYLNS